jgi:5'-deoxynucleotidase YfbR-like HD superfamily hydrolase
MTKGQARSKACRLAAEAVNKLYRDYTDGSPLDKKAAKDAEKIGQCLADIETFLTNKAIKSEGVHG